MKKPKNQAVEVSCTKCDHSQIVYIPKEEIPICPRCGIRMKIRELLTEGKAC